MDSYLEKVDEQGFCILQDVFSADEISEFKQRFRSCEIDVRKTCAEVESDPYEFVQLFEKETKISMRSFDNDSIIELKKGRYDVRTPLVKKSFECIPKAKPIAELMKSLLRERYLCDIGILMTNSNSEHGLWHRDTYNLNGPSNPDGSYDDSLVLQLKPFYFTCLIPLDDIDETNGRTEFIVGSHKLTYSETQGKAHHFQNVKAGSVVVFDGRIFHRAQKHPSHAPRRIIYLVFHRDWYVDV